MNIIICFVDLIGCVVKYLLLIFGIYWYGSTFKYSVIHEWLHAEVALFFDKTEVAFIQCDKSKAEKTIFYKRVIKRSKRIYFVINNELEKNSGCNGLTTFKNNLKGLKNWQISCVAGIGVLEVVIYNILVGALPSLLNAILTCYFRPIKMPWNKLWFMQLLALTVFTILYETLKAVKRGKNDLYFVFRPSEFKSSQEKEETFEDLMKKYKKN